MLNLIPNVKKLALTGGNLLTRAVCFDALTWDERVAAAVKKLPFDINGAPLEIAVTGTEGEGYTLDISEETICVVAESPAGAFYAIQTLRQLFREKLIPCLHIEDRPDFAYRGFYHDVTRGKIPTVETLKKLIDQMAYYKLNSLQLYVEHTFEFEECKELNAVTGFLSKEELLEIGQYCRENFIDFVPSLSTFGHMYEILQQPKYAHLRALKNDLCLSNFWYARMAHHTIDPNEKESIELVQSLIDQYSTCFESDWFNICCDETYDLVHCCENEQDTGRVYVNFVKKITAHTKAKGKKIMMWADILLKHPEVIAEIPEDVCFLNWWYQPGADEERFRKFAQMNRRQIVCPGTNTWSRLCEDIDQEVANICQLAEFAQKYGAEGMLNTNWGDWGNPCSLELAMYGLVLGAEKSWSVATQIDDAFNSRVNALLYGYDQGVEALKKLCAIHAQVNWFDLGRMYFEHRYGEKCEKKHLVYSDLEEIQNAYKAFREKYSAQEWSNDEYRQEMLIAAEGLCVMAEAQAKLEGKKISRITDTDQWLRAYSEKWMKKNKTSELNKIEEMFHYCSAL